MKTSVMEGEREILPSYMPIVTAALAVAMALTLALTGWGMLARLDAALVVHGVLHAESERKTVEHLGGGILSQLLVQSGDMVKAGQVVARLDVTQAREKLAQLRAERDTARFAVWRLAAENAGQPLDPDTAPVAEADDRGALAAEAMRLCQARQNTHAAQVASLTRQIAQLRGQIAAFQGQLRAAEAQLTLWQDERRLVADLVARNATPRRNLLEFDRTLAALAGERDENVGLIEAAKQNIARAEADIDGLRQQRRADIAQSETETRTRLATLDAQIRAMEDVMERHLLRAPQAGQVIKITTVTPGAVLGSGQPLMEILPRDDRLVALIKLPPESIDTVHLGQEAKLRLVAYKRAIAPKVTGEVSYISADLLEDERSGTAYFEARVTLDPASLDELDGILVTAGMPIEVTLAIGERRAGDYLLEPILRHLHRAFREE